MKDLRIASFLPAATEMVYALGLEDRLVGVTHECDYPAAARQKPVLVDCAIDMSRMTPSEIDAAVAARLKSGQSLYKVDEAKLRAAAPSLLVTQDLCQVCGPSGNEVATVLKTLTPKPEILWQTPKTFDAVYAALLELGRKTGTLAKAQALADDARRRAAAVAAKTAGLKKVRVSFLEWVDPVYSAGHWLPAMLAWAGGEDKNAKDGADSTRLDWDEVLRWDPEVIVVAPCGFDLAKSLEQAKSLPLKKDWASLSAVKQGRIYAVDANAYYARPGPRIIDGVELLAHLIHPELFAWTGPKDAFGSVAA